MGFFARLRSVRRPSKLRAASGRAVEMLEGRTLFNATVSSAVAPVTLVPSGPASTVDLSGHFNDPTVTGTTVLISTSQGNIPVTLFDSQVSATVQNFLSYVNSGAYNGTIIHRQEPGFVIQGGGYNTTGAHIATSAPIALQYSIPNTVGTLSMARTSDVNSATSEWFVNLVDNTQTLGPSNGGGYAVFGKVIYNGMTAVNAIAALQRVDDSAQQSAWNHLPVQNYSGPNPATVVPPANMVTVNAAVVPALTYTVSSDNTALVNPALNGTTLTLTPGSGTGIAHITVTATDLGGNVASSTFAVGVGQSPAAPLNTPLGAGGAKQVRFTDADGTFTIISLNGPGSATVALNGSVDSQTLGKNKILNVMGTGMQLADITATGTTDKTTINIIGHGGDGIVQMGGLSTDGALKALNAPTADLAGTNTFGGAVGNVNLLSASAGSLSASAISHMNVKGAYDQNLTAPSVGTFRAGSITGGTWAVSGDAANVSAGSISNWTANFGTLGKLNVKGAIASSKINSAGNISSVGAGSITGSTVFAGVAALPGGQSLPMAASDFAAAATLGAFRVRSFASSNVAAQTLGALTLGSVTTSNGGTPFGVAGHTIKALTATASKKTLRLKNAAAQSDVAAAITKSGFAQGDMLIEIV